METDQAYELFYLPPDIEMDDPLLAVQAACTLRHLVYTGEVDWRAGPDTGDPGRRSGPETA